MPPFRSKTLATVGVLLAPLLAGCFGPSTPDSSRPEKADKWYREAQQQYKDAEFEEAHDAVQKSLAIVPQDPDVRLLAGEVSLASLDFAEVLRVLKGLPGAQAGRLRARALWYKGELDAAADELDALLNDPDAKDDWAKNTSKLAHHGNGRTPFEVKGLLGAVEMVVVSPVAPYFVVPIEIDGEAALAMIATGAGEVYVDSSTRPDPSWISLRFDHLEVRDVPALPQDLSGVSKEVGAPIKAMLGVNLLRHLNATFDFSGHQFVVRSFAAPPPPHATRVDIHYARGGAMLLRSRFGEAGKQATLMVDTHRPFALALDDDGWKKSGVDLATLKPIPNDPDQRLREGEIPLLKLGAFDIPRVPTFAGIPLGDLEKQSGVDLDGVIGSALLYKYRCTFADGGRVLWVEDDYDEIQAMLRSGMRSSGPLPQSGPPSGTIPGSGPASGPSSSPGASQPPKLPR